MSTKIFEKDSENKNSRITVTRFARAHNHNDAVGYQISISGYSPSVTLSQQEIETLAAQITQSAYEYHNKKD